MFVNMPYNNKDCTLIKNLYLLKGYTAQNVAENVQIRLEQVKSLEAAKT